MIENHRITLGIALIFCVGMPFAATAANSPRMDKLEHQLLEAQTALDGLQQTNEDLVRANGALAARVEQLEQSLSKVSAPVADQVSAALEADFQQRVNALLTAYEAHLDETLQTHLTKFDEGSRQQVDTALREQAETFKKEFDELLANASAELAKQNRAEMGKQIAALSMDVQAKADAALRSAGLAESREWSFQTELTARLGKLLGPPKKTATPRKKTNPSKKRPPESQDDKASKESETPGKSR